MIPNSSPTVAAATTTAASGSDRIREFSSVAQATLALGCKTYTGTVAQGGSTPTVTSGRWIRRAPDRSEVEMAAGSRLRCGPAAFSLGGTR